MTRRHAGDASSVGVRACRQQGWEAARRGCSANGRRHNRITRLAIIAVCTTGRSATSAAVERTATAV